jgi:hypothetical protein
VSDVLRFEVAIAGATALPPVDLDADVIELGSASDARLRLPATEVRPHHVRIERAGPEWRLIALDPVELDGAPIARGSVVDLVVPARLVIGRVAIAISAATAGTAASAPQRTASLAREVVRAMVASAGGAPTLVVEAGPGAGTERALEPPPSRVVIGRGEDADWVVVDPDLSRTHLVIERTWDGATVADLGSKNGTKLAGAAVSAAAVSLAHDAVIEAGSTVIRFVDPAAKYLAELSQPPRAPDATVTRKPAPRARSAAAAPVPPPHAPAGSPAVFWTAIAIAVAALAGLIWILQ